MGDNSRKNPIGRPTIKQLEMMLKENAEKEKLTAELIIANKELAFQNKEKDKRAAELIIANRELAFQNREKEKRAAELIIANKELPYVEGDSIMLEMVFTNLISNAIKFTRLKATTNITIASASDPENDDQIIFTVKDNGVGFDMRYQEKLFGVFQRLHSHKDFEGVGIGLANVKHIIQRHGGRVWAESELDKGAAFYFTLPKYEEA